MKKKKKKKKKNKKRKKKRKRILWMKDGTIIIRLLPVQFATCPVGDLPSARESCPSRPGQSGSTRCGRSGAF